MHRTFIVAISFVCASQMAHAMDFAPDDSNDPLNAEATPEDEQAMVGDLDSGGADDNDQTDIRVTRKNALGIRFGEATPHSASGFIWQKTRGEQTALSLAIARGDFRTAEQNEGEPWFENRAKTIAASGRYLWWPNPYFPFAFSAVLSLERSSGTLTSKTGSMGDYQAETAYLGSGLVMSHIFSSGLWVEWTLISFYYGQNLRGTYTSISGTQMERIRSNLEGLKILGFANLALGYAW
jgi:hypothetical protein